MPPFLWDWKLLLSHNKIDLIISSQFYTCSTFVTSVCLLLSLQLCLQQWFSCNEKSVPHESCSSTEPIPATLTHQTLKFYMLQWGFIFCCKRYSKTIALSCWMCACRGKRQCKAFWYQNLSNSLACILNHVSKYDKCSSRSDTRVCPPTGPPGTVVSAFASKSTASVPAISAIFGRSLQRSTNYKTCGGDFQSLVCLKNEKLLHHFQHANYIFCVNSPHCSWNIVI